jgi:hypothetical protein
VGGGGGSAPVVHFYYKVVSYSSVLFRTSVPDSDPGVLHLHIDLKTLKIDVIKKYLFTFFPMTRTRIIGSSDRRIKKLWHTLLIKNAAVSA